MKKTWIFAIILVVVILLFITFEGFSSIIITYKAITNEVVKRKPLAERMHTKYDKDLGWLNISNIYIKDMYGPGVYLKTNSQALRNNDEFSISVPDGKIRIICSGDSFTFGYGVDNDNTWCQLLTTMMNRKLEAVNMGQGGYGIDQAYLWYKRDGVKFEHDIHVFAFIDGDFWRMQRNIFLGYGKPIIELENNVLVTKNIPVPPPIKHSNPRLRHCIRAINNLNVIKLIRSFLPHNENSYGKSKNYNTQKVVSKIFEDLQKVNRAKQSILVLVFLPTKNDYTEKTSKPWQDFLYAEATHNKYIYIDLIEELKKLPQQKIEKLFIPEGVIDYYGATGHYTKEGNKFIAYNLYKKLVAIPEIAIMFQEK